ncbi:MAG: S8/S53 family peptidase [Pseudonocardia sp.]
MDAVFDAQFRNMRVALAAQGVDVEIAYTASGEVDYVYEVDRILILDQDDNIVDQDGNVSRVLNYLSIPERIGSDEIRRAGGIVELSIAGLPGGALTVPEALDLIDSRERERTGTDGPRAGELPLASPNHLMYITRLCPAGEPEVPSGDPQLPWPPPRPGGGQGGGAGVLIGVADTGLLQNLDTVNQYPWLSGVTGEPDLLPALTGNGEQRIPEFVGHGTFIAGVARSVAPGAGVHVADHLTLSGGVLETAFRDKLIELLARSPAPGVLSLSAGTYTRRNQPSVVFQRFFEDHLDGTGVKLVAAAGNDGTSREFWPAAFPWAMGVGALGPDEQHRAWFSNFGSWVNVYALGEGMVNAYATGVYTYQEPPKRPAKQAFTGMARWDGTSYSTPLVVGLIAARMSREGESAVVATDAVLAVADNQRIPGLGPALRATDTP